MNFYFNYFASIGREHINCNRNRNHTCKIVFPEKGKKFFFCPFRSAMLCGAHCSLLIAHRSQKVGEKFCLSRASS